MVELLIAVTLGLFIVAAMLGLLARNSEARGELEKSGRQVENGRYALQRLSEDLRHAGFYGDFGSPVVPAIPPLASEVCQAGLDTAGLMSLKQLMGMPVQAFTEKPSCIDAADFVPGTNVLVVRFASAAPKLGDDWAEAALAGLAVESVYVQANTEDMTLVRRTGGSSLVSSDGTNFTASKRLKVLGQAGSPPGTLINARLLRVITRIYFISPCSRPSCAVPAEPGEGPPVPSLKMFEPLELSATPAPVVVAEGIERLEFDYGIDTPILGPVAGIAKEYRRCCLGIEWPQVVSVRISLLARNAEPSAGFSDNKTYVMGLAGAASAPADSLRFKRHAFQQVVRLTNISMRREE